MVVLLVQECQSLKGAVRYLLHRDDPNKYQYDVEDIRFIGGMKAQRLFQDYLSEDGEEDRQFQVVMDYATYQIDLIEAMKRAPELFIHKFNNVKTLVKAIRMQQYGKRDIIDDELRREYPDGVEVE